MDPNINPNKALQEQGFQPAAQQPVTPTPQIQTPAPMGVNANAAMQTQGLQAPVQQAPSSPQTNITISTEQPNANQSAPATNAPGTSLQPGAQGQDVQALQNYLVQQGYLTPEQVATGPGIYGPKTTAAVAKLQQDLGINAPNGVYGSQTQNALASKYQNIFSTVKGSPTPDQPAAAREAIQSVAEQANSKDPVMGAMTSAMEPIMQSLTQVLANINNPALTATSLQQEYNDLRSQFNLPAMQSQMMNLQRIMNGTVDDIRDEVTAAGGFATESQVQGIAAARNKTLLKQYNSLSTQYDAAQSNVDAMLKYAQTDQSNALQRQQMTATVTGTLASIQNQMMQMGMTMQNNARQAVQYNVTQMGYKGLVDGAQGNPQVLSYYENMLGLAPGSLSDPNAVASMDTYKDQQLQLNNYRAAVAAFQAGYGAPPGGGSGGTGGSTPIGMTGGQVGVTPVDPATLSRPSWVDPKVPLTLSADQMEAYTNAQKAAHTDPGTNNIVAPGIGYYVQQSDGSYVLQSALPSPIEKQYQSIKQTMDSSGVFQGSPTVTRKWTLSANAAISSFKDTGTYKIASNVAPYLAAIHAAAVNPGDKSISDFELLDSFVKAAKGGTGQVTDSQVNVMLQGASIGDRWDKLQQKLQQGGVLSTAQRQSLVSLADETYKRNLEDYQKGYVQAVQAMQGQGIPPQFWRNLPDFSSLEPVTQ